MIWCIFQNEENWEFFMEQLLEGYLKKIFLISLSVFYERRISSTSDITPIEVPATAIDTSFATSFAEPNSQAEPPPELYVRSEYAPAYGLEIEKRYTDISSGYLKSGDRIRVQVSLKNTTTNTISNISYLDTIPQIFDIPENPVYTVSL